MVILGCQTTLPPPSPHLCKGHSLHTPLLLAETRIWSLLKRGEREKYCVPAISGPWSNLSEESFMLGCWESSLKTTNAPILSIGGLLLGQPSFSVCEVVTNCQQMPPWMVRPLHVLCLLRSATQVCIDIAWIVDRYFSTCISQQIFLFLPIVFDCWLFLQIFLVFTLWARVFVLHRI